ncbi:hypothetical protein [Microbacterium sp. CH12i]|uniref:hypothetical protein n=1 Tax=Microbacterium sp. CH12i TaxID=1479651 RepID=UPI000AA2204A|nr:hypothetical protein [Microbacterium sp. CH12i]
MVVIALTSFAGAPGVTTAATALAVHWPRPVLLVEADTNAVSSLMTGFFRSNLRTTDGGIEKLAFAFSRDSLEAEDLLDSDYGLSIPVHDLPPIPTMPIPAIPDGHKMWVIPGFVNLGVVDGVRSLWAKLPRLLGALADGGIDVIVDLGHLDIDDDRLPLVDTADRVVVSATASMVDLNRTYRRLELSDLNDRARAPGSERYWTLLNTTVSERIPAREFSTHVLPVLATLPHDPSGAACSHTGDQTPSDPERL